MREDILGFTVIFYSKDGETSPVLDFIESLVKSNKEMAKKALHALKRLPAKIFDGQDIKPFSNGKHKFWELRVKSESNICRFFFVVEQPNVIVVYGFAKKTQKTDLRDVQAGITCLEDFYRNKLTININ